MSGVVAPPQLLEFEGVAPSGGARRLFRILRGQLLDHYFATANVTKIEEAFWIPDICDCPSGIWVNLGRRDHEQHFCYSGIPSGAFAARFFAGRLSFPLGFTFLVFTTPDLVVSDWSLAKMAEGNPGFPVGHETRFGERLWPRD